MQCVICNRMNFATIQVLICTHVLVVHFFNNISSYTKVDCYNLYIVILLLCINKKQLNKNIQNTCVVSAYLYGYGHCVHTRVPKQAYFIFFKDKEASAIGCK